MPESLPAEHALPPGEHKSTLTSSARMFTCCDCATLATVHHWLSVMMMAADNRALFFPLFFCFFFFPSRRSKGAAVGSQPHAKAGNKKILTLLFVLQNFLPPRELLWAPVTGGAQARCEKHRKHLREDLMCTPRSHRFSELSRGDPPLEARRKEQSIRSGVRI